MVQKHMKYMKSQRYSIHRWLKSTRRCRYKTWIERLQKHHLSQTHCSYSCSMEKHGHAEHLTQVDPTSCEWSSCLLKCSYLTPAFMCANRFDSCLLIMSLTVDSYVDTKGKRSLRNKKILWERENWVSHSTVLLIVLFHPWLFSCSVTLAVSTLLLFLRPAWEAEKSTTFPTLHLEQKNMGWLEVLDPLGR